MTDLHLTTADSQHAPGAQHWTLRLRLDDGAVLFLHMGAQTLNLFRALAIDALGEPVTPQVVGLDARVCVPVPAGERGQLALGLGEAAG